MKKPRKPPNLPLGDYEVGFGKPPVHTRFKPGQCGNPKGRRKGSQDFRTFLKRELEDLVTIKENGRERRRSKKEIMTKVIINKAIKGDLRAWMEIMKLAQEAGLEKPAHEAQIVPLSPDHAAIVQRAIAARLAQAEDDAEGAEDGTSRDDDGSEEAA